MDGAIGGLNPFDVALSLDLVIEKGLGNRSQGGIAQVV